MGITGGRKAAPTRHQSPAALADLSGQPVHTSPQPALAPSMPHGVQGAVADCAARLLDTELGAQQMVFVDRRNRLPPTPQTKGPHKWGLSRE